MTTSRYRLEVVKGFEEGRVFPLEDEQISIGRAEDNDISIPVAEVSRNHAVLSQVDDGYMIKDLGSTNGTFIDRKKIGGKYLLSPGDTVMLGDAVHLVFRAEAAMDDTLTATPPAPLKVPEAPNTQPAKQPAPPSAPPASAPPASAPPAPEKAPPPPPAPPEVSKEGLEDLQESELEGQEERKTWLWAGIGCLVLVIFVLVLGLIAFDYLNLYCTPPFDSLFDFLYTCPGA